MKIEIPYKVSGQINWLEVRDKEGRLKHRVENVPNIILNAGIGTDATLSAPSNNHRTFESSTPVYDDVDGLWSQSGNIVTRSSGTGTFPASPTRVGDELYWYDAGGDTGHRVHVTARANDTSITVSGVAKTITDGKLRRYSVNGSGSSDYGGTFKQESSSVTSVSDVFDDTAGTRTRTWRANYGSAASAYNLRSIIMLSFARVVLPSDIAIEVDDQLQYEYTYVETLSGRSQTYELGAEAVGIPQKHSMTSIVGNGTNVDVTFSGATHFLAGDKLDLRGVTTKKIAISSITSDGTKWTINTAAAHGLSVSDNVVIEGATVGAYNGTWPVATVVDTDTFEITDASNPGSSGAAGTVSLEKPASYFDDLGLATIASMVSSSVARITSTMTGPDVNPADIGGDPGVEIRFKRKSSNSGLSLQANTAGSMAFTTANAKALMDPTTVGTTSNTGSSWTFDSVSTTNSAASNDFTQSHLLTKNAGAGTNATRIKQILVSTSATPASCDLQITFNTPFDKTTAQRLRVTVSKKIVRDIVTP